MSNLLSTILKTIDAVQSKNKKSRKVETADPSVFDELRKQVKDLDQDYQGHNMQKGRKPKPIFDLLKKIIDGTRKANKKDPNVATADKSVFDEILSKVQKAPQRQASSGLKKIVEDYNLDIGRLPQETIVQIQDQYQSELQALNQKYAEGIHKMIKQAR